MPGWRRLGSRQVHLVRQSHLVPPPWRHLLAQQDDDTSDEGNGHYQRRGQRGKVTHRRIPPLLEYSDATSAVSYEAARHPGRRSARHVRGQTAATVGAPSGRPTSTLTAHRTGHNAGPAPDRSPDGELRPQSEPPPDHAARPCRPTMPPGPHPRGRAAWQDRRGPACTSTNQRYPAAESTARWHVRGQPAHVPR